MWILNDYPPTVKHWRIKQFSKAPASNLQPAEGGKAFRFHITSLGGEQVFLSLTECAESQSKLTYVAALNGSPLLVFKPTLLNFRLSTITNEL